ncbi:MAG: DNA-binding protein WhiA [Eubacteriales bacterium]
MSFSSQTKKDICTIDSVTKCCLSAELSALIHTCGSINFEGNNRISFTIRTENAAIARRVFKIIKTNYRVEASVIVTKNRQFKNKNIYTVKVAYQSNALEILMDLHILLRENGLISINPQIPSCYGERKCCKRAYIRGAFLGGGSISNPDKAYHVEFICRQEEYALQLMQLINSYDLKAKTVQRKNNNIVYLKEGEQIITLLNVIGAHKTLFNMENVRIMKEMRNNVNRLVNCETANLSKTVEAAYRQIESIQIIQKKMGLNKLPQKLRDIAELRINYQDASLKELGEMLNPPVGKSGVNHRLKKIEEIAQGL